MTVCDPWNKVIEEKFKMPPIVEKFELSFILTDGLRVLIRRKLAFKPSFWPDSTLIDFS